MRSLIHSLPTFPATLAPPQSAAITAGCDRAWQDEEMRSLIHSLPTYPATLVRPQSAAVTAGCDRLLPDVACTLSYSLTHLDND